MTDKKNYPPLLGPQFAPSTPQNKLRDDTSAKLSQLAAHTAVTTTEQLAKAPKASEDIDAVDAAIDPDAKPNKIKAYLDNLERLNISQEHARAVIDDVLYKGYYSEEYMVLNRIPVKFKTRSYADLMRTHRLLEAEAARIAMHVNDQLVRYNLAASLVSYGETTFPVLPAAVDGRADTDAQNLEYQKKLDFIQQLPLQVAIALIQLLHKFDEKTFAVFEEGAPEDF